MKKRMKSVICLALVLIMVLSFSNAAAFAAETKSVTVTIQKTFTCPSSQIGNYMRSIVSSTYNYDDGTFSGVLSYVRVSSWNQTLVSGTSDVYQYNLGVEYTGTVTRYYTAPTKDVTMTVQRTFTCPGSQVGFYMQPIVNSTLAYDDGNYRGTLSYVRVSSWNQTLVAGTTDVYLYDLEVEYSGTATYYH